MFNKEVYFRAANLCLELEKVNGNRPLMVSGINIVELYKIYQSRKQPISSTSGTSGCAGIFLAVIGVIGLMTLIFTTA